MGKSDAYKLPVLVQSRLTLADAGAVLSWFCAVPVRDPVCFWMLFSSPLTNVGICMGGDTVERRGTI